MSRFPESLLDEIRTRTNITQVVGEYVIWDKKKSQPKRGDMWACCPFHGEKSPSFHADDRKGIYHCFGCGVTGDHFKFIMEKTGKNFPEAVEAVASMAGIALPERARRRDESDEDRARREAELERDRAQVAKKRAELQREEAERKAERTQNAAEVWAQTVPILGTHGEAYFVARGINPIAQWPWDCSDTIRFHPALVSEKEWGAGPFPAVICKVVDAFGEFIAIWQIFLDPVKPQKAPLELPKLGRGPAGGGAVRIGGDGPDISASEGVETALGAWELDHYTRPSWSLLSTSGMIGFEPPMFIKMVRTWPDADRGKIDREKRFIHEPPGMHAARELQKRLLAAGIPNPINEMTRHGDALNMLVARKRLEGLITA